MLACSERGRARHWGHARRLGQRRGLSLERLMSWAEVPFAPSVDSSEPTPEETARVDKILAEADDNKYWFAASKDGNRVSHYRGMFPSSASYEPKQALSIPASLAQAFFGHQIPMLELQQGNISACLSTAHADVQANAEEHACPPELYKGRAGAMQGSTWE